MGRRRIKQNTGPDSLRLRRIVEARQYDSQANGCPEKYCAARREILKMRDEGWSWEDLTWKYRSID